MEGKVEGTNGHEWMGEQGMVERSRVREREAYSTWRLGMVVDGREEVMMWNV